MRFNSDYADLKNYCQTILNNMLEEAYLRVYDNTVFKEAAYQIGSKISETRELFKNTNNVVKLCDSYIIQGKSNIQDNEFDWMFPCIKIDFINHNLSWIEHINIYVSSGLVWDNQGNEQQLDEPDTVIIENTKIAKYNNGNFIYQDVLFEVRQKVAYQYERPLRIKSDKSKIESATIMFILPTDEWDVHQLCYIVQHEISHLYDLFIKDITYAELNKDVIFKENLKPGKDNQKYTKMLLNLLFPLKRKINIIKNSDGELISDTFTKMVYMLNESEMNARLSNFEGDLEKNKDSIVLDKKVDIDEQKYDIAINLSTTFDEYCMLKELCNLFLKYTSKEEKQLFAQKDICYIYGAYTELGGYVYGKSFDFDGKYDERSFDEFFLFHIKRIDRYFIEPALTYLKENYLVLEECHQFFKSRRKGYCGWLMEDY